MSIKKKIEDAKASGVTAKEVGRAAVDKAEEVESVVAGGTLDRLAIRGLSAIEASARAAAKYEVPLPGLKVQVHFSIGVMKVMQEVSFDAAQLAERRSQS